MRNLSLENVLVGNNHLLVSESDTETIITGMLKNALDLIPACDAGTISLLNPRTGLLEIVYTIGYEGVHPPTALTPGEGLMGIAFQSGQTGLYGTREEVKAAVSGIRPETASHIRQARGGPLYNASVNGAISCPLLIHGEKLGAAALFNFHHPDAQIGESDVRVFESITQQAAIALFSSTKFEQEKQLRKDLLERSILLEREKEKYRYSVELHRRFTDILLHSAPLEEILRQISSLLNYSVFFSDLFYTMLGQHTNDRADLSCAERTLSIFSTELRPADGTWPVPGNPEKEIRFRTVSAMGEALGWLGILTPAGHDYSEQEDITIRQGCSSLALCMLKQRDLSMMESNLRGDLFDHLLRNIDSEYSRLLAANLHYRADRKHRLILFSFFMENDRSPVRPEDGLLSRCENIVRRAAEEAAEQSMTFRKGDSILLLTEEPQDCRARLSRFAERTLRQMTNSCRIARTNYIPCACISGGIDHSGQYASVFRELQRTLTGAFRRSDRETPETKSYLFYEDLEVENLLTEISSERLDAFMRSALGPLIEGGGNPELLRTLEIYLNSCENWTHTKNTLCIHGNTLNYRLRRIADLTGLDTHIYKDRLRLQLALRIREMLET